MCGPLSQLRGALDLYRSELMLSAGAHEVYSTVYWGTMHGLQVHYK